MGDRSSRRLRTLVTRMVHRDLSAKKNAGALISMMARSSNRSNQRPDTLMQDCIPSDRLKTSCNARPDHTFGSSSTVVYDRPDGILSFDSFRARRVTVTEDMGPGCVKTRMSATTVAGESRRGIDGGLCARG